MRLLQKRNCETSALSMQTGLFFSSHQRVSAVAMMSTETQKRRLRFHLLPQIRRPVLPRRNIAYSPPCDPCYVGLTETSREARRRSQAIVQRWAIPLSLNRGSELVWTTVLAHSSSVRAPKERLVVGALKMTVACVVPGIHESVILRGGQAIDTFGSSVLMPGDEAIRDCGGGVFNGAAGGAGSGLIVPVVLSGVVVPAYGLFRLMTPRSNFCRSSEMTKPCLDRRLLASGIARGSKAQSWLRVFGTLNCASRS
jgi:hypothetical protein